MATQQVYKAKAITDIFIGCKFSKSLRLSVEYNNILKFIPTKRWIRVRGQATNLSIQEEQSRLALMEDIFSAELN